MGPACDGGWGWGPMSCQAGQRRLSHPWTLHLALPSLTQKMEMDYQAQQQASEDQVTKLKRDLEAQKRDFLNQLGNKDAQMEKV